MGERARAASVRISSSGGCGRLLDRTCVSVNANRACGFENRPPAAICRLRLPRTRSTYPSSHSRRASTYGFASMPHLTDFGGFVAEGLKTSLEDFCQVRIVRFTWTTDGRRRQQTDREPRYLRIKKSGMNRSGHTAVLCFALANGRRAAIGQSRNYSSRPDFPGRFAGFGGGSRAVAKSRPTY